MATPTDNWSHGRWFHRFWKTVVVFSAAAVLSVVLAVAGDAYVTHHRRAPAAAAKAPAAKTVTATVEKSQAGHQVSATHARRPKTRARVASAEVAPAPLVVTAVTPGSGTSDVATNAPLTVAYSEPLAAKPPLPTLNPPVAGTWSISGSVLTFVPAGGWLPYATETVTVPPGATAVVGGRKTSSKVATTTTFTVQHGSDLRVEQFLSELKYLPFTFTPASLPPGVTSGLDAESSQADAVSTSPLPGTLNWAYPNVPPSLGQLWTPGQYNTIDKGAIMAFENAQNMTMDGVAGPKVWAALVSAVAARQATSQPYDYLIASETLPESLQVWRNGQIIYTTAANTGVPGASTEPGTFPVFERQSVGTMSGTNPDGTKYVDPGIPWIAYFNGGDAVHGFIRPGYGYPQSDGCVELPIPNAAQVWQMDPYGTLVTVLPPS